MPMVHATRPVLVLDRGRTAIEAVREGTTQKSRVPTSLRKWGPGTVMVGDATYPTTP